MSSRAVKRTCHISPRELRRGCAYCSQHESLPRPPSLLALVAPPEATDPRAERDPPLTALPGRVLAALPGRVEAEVVGREDAAVVGREEAAEREERAEHALEARALRAPLPLPLPPRHATLVALFIAPTLVLLAGRPPLPPPPSPPLKRSSRTRTVRSWPPHAINTEALPLMLNATASRSVLRPPPPPPAAAAASAASLPPAGEGAPERAKRMVRIEWRPWASGGRHGRGGVRWTWQVREVHTHIRVGEETMGNKKRRGRVDCVAAAQRGEGGKLNQEANQGE